MVFYKKDWIEGEMFSQGHSGVECSWQMHGKNCNKNGRPS
jgi:hypothetical protein